MQQLQQQQINALSRLVLLALSQIGLVLAKSRNKILEHKLQDLFKMQMLNSKLKNVGPLKMTIVSQLPKERDGKNNEVFAWEPDKNHSKFLPTIPKHQILTSASQDKNIRPALIRLHRPLPAIVA